MARIRTIKPEFFKNDRIAELPALSRILFIGLWTLADCEGRLEDRVKRIKAEVLPYDNFDADKGLNDLAMKGLIVRYKVDANSNARISTPEQPNQNAFIQIIGFRKHQRITGSEAESESEIPQPTESNIVTEETNRKHFGNTLETPRTTGREGKGKERNMFIAPEFEEVKQFCKENDFEGIASKVFKYYSEANWVDSKGNKVLNWKQKIRGVWFKQENQAPYTTITPVKKMII